MISSLGIKALGIKPWSRGNSRAAIAPKLCPKLRANAGASNDRDDRASTRRETASPAASSQLVQMHQRLLGLWFLKIQFSGLGRLQTYISFIASLF